MPNLRKMIVWDNFLLKSSKFEKIRGYKIFVNVFLVKQRFSLYLAINVLLKGENFYLKTHLKSLLKFKAGLKNMLEDYKWNKIISY
jgi:hypothetical protein